MVHLVAQIALSLLAAIVLGYFIGWLLTGNRWRALYQTTEQTLSQRNVQLGRFKSDLEEAQFRLQALDEAITSLDQKLVSKEVDVANLRYELEATKDELAAAQKDIKEKTRIIATLSEEVARARAQLRAQAAQTPHET